MASTRICVFAIAAPVTLTLTWSCPPTGGQLIEIYELAKSEYGAGLVNTFYPSNDPQTIDFRERHSLKSPYDERRRASATDSCGMEGVL